MVLGIYGTGGAGREVRDIFDINMDLKHKYKELIFIDDLTGKSEYEGLQCMPFKDAILRYGSNLFVNIAVGEPKNRELLYNRVKGYGIRLENIIHPDNFISPTAVISEGVVLQKGVTISSHAIIGDNVCLQRYAVIGHDAIIGEHSQISNHVAIGGHTKLGSCCYVGLNAAIRDRLTIGKHAIVGMGSIVVKNVPDYAVVAGNPAKYLRKNIEGQVFMNSDSSTIVRGGVNLNNLILLLIHERRCAA